MPSLPQITISHGVVINVTFNTCFGSIICHTSKFYFKVFLNVILNYLVNITTGQIFLLNYKLSRFSK
jgi:hypothetical protein